MVTIFTLSAERVADVTLGDDLHSADLSPLRGGRFWFDIEPESHFLGNPPSGLWGNGAITGPRDPMVPVKIDVHPDADPALFVCQNPETVLQTGRSAPEGRESHRNRCAGPISSGRLADLSSLRGGRFWGRGLMFLRFSSHFPPFSGNDIFGRPTKDRARQLPEFRAPGEGFSRFRLTIRPRVL